MKYINEMKQKYRYVVYTNGIIFGEQIKLDNILKGKENGNKNRSKTILKNFCYIKRHSIKIKKTYIINFSVFSYYVS